MVSQLFKKISPSKFFNQFRKPFVYNENIHIDPRGFSNSEVQEIITALDTASEHPPFVKNCAIAAELSKKPITICFKEHGGGAAYYGYLFENLKPLPEENINSIELNINSLNEIWFIDEFGKAQKCLLDEVIVHEVSHLATKALKLRSKLRNLVIDCELEDEKKAHAYFLDLKEKYHSAFEEIAVGETDEYRRSQGRGTRREYKNYFTASTHLDEEALNTLFESTTNAIEFAEINDPNPGTREAFGSRFLDIAHVHERGKNSKQLPIPDQEELAKTLADEVITHMTKEKHPIPEYNESGWAPEIGDHSLFQNLPSSGILSSNKRER